MDDEGVLDLVYGVIVRLQDPDDSSALNAKVLAKYWRWDTAYREALEKETEQYRAERLSLQHQSSDIIKVFLSDYMAGGKIYQIWRALAPRGWDYVFVMDSSMKYTYVHPQMIWRMRSDSSKWIGHREEELFDEPQDKTSDEIRNELLTRSIVRRKVTRPVDGERRVFEEVLIRVLDKPPENAFIKAIDGGMRGISSQNGTPNNSLESRDSLFDGIMHHLVSLVQDLNSGIGEIFGISRLVPYPESGASRSLQAGQKSKVMRDVFALATKAAAGDSTVLLTGESGSGKDYIAEWIHAHSKRKDSGMLVSINCTTLPEHLFESELFGYEAGAFTGAGSRKPGLIELATGGTLLLDEIGEMPLHLQPKLLMFLEKKPYRRLGGQAPIIPDFRIIAATNRDLQKAVDAGTFRSDLFFRLKVLHIDVPPLRKRREDIPGIVSKILTKKAGDFRLESIPRLDDGLMEELCQYSWPGNVRELENALERALAVNTGAPIRLFDLLPELATQARPTRARPVEALKADDSDVQRWRKIIDFPGDRQCTYNDAIDEVKRSFIDEAFRRANGDKAQVAKQLGMTRHALRRQLKTLNYPEPE